MTTPTPEAIEAASRALCLLTYGVEWEHVSEAGRKPLREEARAALTAAYPLIEASAKAEALREAADDWRNMQRTDDHLLAQWLRARAATIETEAS